MFSSAPWSWNIWRAAGFARQGRGSPWTWGGVGYGMYFLKWLSLGFGGSMGYGSYFVKLCAGASSITCDP